MKRLAVVMAVVLMALSGAAGGVVDRTISAFAGIDVLGTQTNRAVRLKLPAAFGPFKEATSFADEKGRIHQIVRLARFRDSVI